MATPNTLVNFQQFISISQSNGAFNVWTDILAKEWKENLTNQEVLGVTPFLTKMVDGIGDNIELQIQVLPGVNYLNAGNFDVQQIKTHKVMAHIGTDYEGSFQVDIRDQKSSVDWSRYLGNEVAGITKRRSDQNNLIAMEAIINTCLATGSYVIDPVVGSADYSKEEYYDASQRLVRKANTLASFRSKYHLGTPVDRIKLLGSYDAIQNIVIGQNFISSANLSLEKYSSGEPGKVMSYDNARTIYLGKKVDFMEDVGTSAERQVYAKSFDFTNYSALIYQLDSLRVYGHYFTDPIINSNMVADAITKKINKAIRLITFMWRINAFISPGFEPLNVLVCNRAPTLAEINAARTQLRTEQPGLYNTTLGTALPDLTQEQVDAMNEHNDIYSKRVVIVEGSGDDAVNANLLSGQSLAINTPIATSGSSYSLQINSAFKNMSFDLNSVKFYGGLSGKVNLLPQSNTELTIKSTDTLTADSMYFTIDVKRGSEVFGTLYCVVKASA